MTMTTADSRAVARALSRAARVQVQEDAMPDGVVRGVFTRSAARTVLRRPRVLTSLVE
jgi:hypothetical protein